MAAARLQLVWFVSSAKYFFYPVSVCFFANNSVQYSLSESSSFNSLNTAKYGCAVGLTVSKVKDQRDQGKKRILVQTNSTEILTACQEFFGLNYLVFYCPDEF